MKKAQLIGIAIAGVCGLAAFVVAQKFVPKQQVQQPLEDTSAKTASVLVARDKLGMGQIATESSFRWQDWPDGPGQVPPNFIVRRPGTNPIKDYAGRIVRIPVSAGEPITDEKLIVAGQGGVLAAILPDGMRAISTKITEDSAVGRLILPNDHVDVILTRRIRSNSGAEQHVSEVVFTDVRVLAIGQIIQAADGKKSSDGNTATLQLAPDEAERLAQAKAQGEISLALRSILALTKKEERPVGRKQSTRVIYGVRSGDSNY
jgi:pilus assembly protein CpaB